MPIHLQYDEEKDILRAKVHDRVSLEEINEVLQAITGSKEYLHSVSTIWDTTDLDFNQLDKDFFERLTQLRKQYPARGAARIAFVVDNDYAFGMCRMGELLAQVHDLPQVTMVFRDYMAGEQWLLRKSNDKHPGGGHSI